MADSNTDGSIFSEMAERRSRSDELQAKAIEQGLAFVPSSETEVPEPAFEPEDQEMKPAFDMERFESELVSENELQRSEPAAIEGEADSEETDLIRSLDTTEEASENIAGEVIVEAKIDEPRELSAPDAEEEESTIPSEPEASAEDIEPLVSDETESVEEPRPVAESSETAQEGAEETPSSPEDLIQESGDLLGEAPEPIADAEVIMAAEDLVDQIGSVVDIQSLPKTQPSRVMSKVAQSEEKPPEKSSSDAIRLPEEKEIAKPAPKNKKPDPTAAKPKKKKKKISLLDSYFKGL